MRIAGATGSPVTGPDVNTAEPVTGKPEKITWEDVKMKYAEQMEQDIREYLKDNYSPEQLFTMDEELGTYGLADKLYDEMFTADSVTGNGSGSYFFSRAKAREMVLADGIDYLREATREGFLTEHQFTEWFMEENWEAIDVTIRCYLLGAELQMVLESEETY